MASRILVWLAFSVTQIISIVGKRLCQLCTSPANIVSEI